MATHPHDTRHAPDEPDEGLPAPQPVEPDDGASPPVDEDQDGSIEPKN
jgi:hypothetical protein